MVLTMSQNTSRRQEATSTRKPPRPRRAAREPRGPEALRGYLADQGLSHAQFADQIGVTRSHVGMILGGSPPSLGCAVRIEELTGIKCADWVAEAA